MIFKKKERKIKNRISIIVSFVLLFLGVLLFIFPWFNVNEPVNLLYLLFAVYAGVKLIEYILTRNGTDREALYTSVACMLASFSGFKFSGYNAPMVLSLTLISWVGIMSIIKLIKLDYYHIKVMFNYDYCIFIIYYFFKSFLIFILFLFCFFF